MDDDLTPPLVAEDDVGINTSRPGECYYCGSHVGTPHDETCVAWSRVVHIVLHFEDEMYNMTETMPVSWDGDKILCHLNHGGGGFCMGNLTTQVKESVDIFAPGPKIMKSPFCTCGMEGVYVSLAPQWKGHVLSTSTAQLWPGMEETQ